MATITLTVPDAAVPRLALVVGQRIGAANADGTPRNATAAELKQFVAAFLQNTVREGEVAAAAEAARAQTGDLPVS